MLSSDVTTSLLELIVLLAANRANNLEDSLALMQIRPADHVRGRFPSSLLKCCVCLVETHCVFRLLTTHCCEAHSISSTQNFK